MTATNPRRIHIGNRNFNPSQWTDFGWDDPRHGPQIKGEVAVIRDDGTSGSLAAGLWRTGHEIAGCEPDGSCRVKYSAPLGDETMVILEGSVRITETASGKQHNVAAGSILSHPKHMDLYWEISRPFLKKFWVIWDCPTPGTREDHLYVASIHDNPPHWNPCTWDHPTRGPQVCGEFHVIRGTGSTGSLQCGLWRTGVGLAGCAPDGSASVRHASPRGDETMLLLEGQAQLVNDETGEIYHLEGGDVIGLPAGLPVTWTSRGPYLKLFRVTTRAA